MTLRDLPSPQAPEREAPTAKARAMERAAARASFEEVMGSLFRSQKYHEHPTLIDDTGPVEALTGGGIGWGSNKVPVSGIPGDVNVSALAARRDERPEDVANGVFRTNQFAVPGVIERGHDEQAERRRRGQPQKVSGGFGGGRRGGDRGEGSEGGCPT
jgi:hypothetical protein